MEIAKFKANAVMAQTTVKTSLLFARCYGMKVLVFVNL
jgi:hypothetical protein